MKVSVLRRTGALFVSFVLACSLCIPLTVQQASAQENSLTAQSTELAVTDSPSNASATLKPVAYAGVGIAARAKMQGEGWGAWTTEQTIGSTSSKGVNAIQLRLTGLQGLSGHIQYQVYKRNGGWKTKARDGASSGSAKYVEAVRIKLTGNVSKQYDVLYRSYVSGKGWQPWVKNNAKSGIVNKKRRVLAIQVKLSPKTEEAYGKSTSKVGVLYQARLASSGWQVWKRDGSKAGKASKALYGLAVKLDAGSLSGGIKYRAYSKGNGWQAWKADGAFAGVGSKRLDAVRMKLTGDLAKTYDVYYRAYVESVGWLGWAKNGATSGSTGYGLRLEAFQVKLVLKGQAAPGDTQYPTVNLMEASQTMNGIDISSWQAGINVSKVKADFVIVKATGATGYTNSYFKKWADATLASGKQLGLYHYARDASNPGSAVAEAKHFVKAIQPYVGKAVLVLDFEGDALEMGEPVKWAKKFMDTVYKKTGVKPLIYLSQSVTYRFDWSSVAKKYKLWVAQYLYRNFYTGYLVNPGGGSDLGYWGSAQMYQYSSTGKVKGYSGYLDLNKFYGTVLTWKTLAQKS